jgi:hypothetical protein
MASWFWQQARNIKNKTDKHYNIWSEISKTFA